MCGIHLSVLHESCCARCGQAPWHPNNNNNRDSSIHTINVVNLQRRGPTALNHISITVAERYTRISLHASVLQMRQHLVVQPVKIVADNINNNNNSNKHSYYLCWNGEVYESYPFENAGDFGTSDTTMVANRLAERLNGNNDETVIAEILRDLYNAEYAFLILRSDGQMFYGRDHWGRRSLLRFECNECHSLVIASVAPFPRMTDHDTDHGAVWEEIVPGHVHVSSAGHTPTLSTSVPIPSMPRMVMALDDTTVHEAVDPCGMASLQLEILLSNAVKRRMENHETAVLFSGGLDSAVVAAMAARHCKEKLYLYNVSFGPTYEKSADRQAALITHRTLQDRYPEKRIIFQDIVVSWEDICDHEPHIRTILQPKATLMDVNIATALWFASRGGKSAEMDGEESNKPRVLLLGMGADELLGGYGRHRHAFERGGWEELRKELTMDQERFWERNLGRDDRIVADHGCEARFPFLDCRVTEFLQNLPLSSICDFSLPAGQGDKRILRLVAARLGIEHASGLVKRAIQFGSRISHLSDAKRFGSRRKAKGDASVATTK
jgi:asparagine synthetase B (glutamine-hydrolysing)